MKIETNNIETLNRCSAKTLQRDGASRVATFQDVSEKWVARATRPPRSATRRPAGEAMKPLEGGCDQSGAWFPFGPAGRLCHPPSCGGFTLIEMILAIGISAIVLIVVNAAFFSSLRLRDATSNTVDAASPVDAAVTFLKRDLQCAVTPTNGTSKVLSGGFRAGSGLTSVGVSDPVAIEMYTATGALSDSEPWGDIQRVTYELKNPAVSTATGRDLYRSVVRNLLSVATPDVTDQLMLSGVASLKFSCFDGAQWNDTWDTTDPSAINTNLPVAVRVDIQMAGRADAGPIEIVVPIDSQSRTNMVLNSGTGG
jgi:type II secretion system protein J